MPGKPNVTGYTESVTLMLTSMFVYICADWKCVYYVTIVITGYIFCAYCEVSQSENSRVLKI